MHTLRWVFAALICAVAMAAPAQSRDPRELVAMIRVQSADRRTEDFGAAIVVSQTRARTVLITAAHVVYQGEGEPHITTEFRALPDKRFTARLSEYSARERGMDLAVLFVESAEVPQFLTPELASSVLSANPDSLVGRDAVLVGFMNRRPWEQSLSGEPIVRASATEIAVTSNYVDVGASGGALFDAESRSLIGMVIEDSQKRAIALPIGLLLDQLKHWNVEVALRYDSQAMQIAAERQLAQLGYAVSAAGLAQALVAADARALDLFTTAKLPLTIIQAALRTRVDGQATIAQRYFEASREAPRAIGWLVDVAKRSSDPLDANLRVPHSMIEEEALINVAARAGNVDAVLALLESGAEPHGYQNLTNWLLDEPRFLLPLHAVMQDERMTGPDKRRLSEQLVRRGVVIPKVPLPARSGAQAMYGPIASTVALAESRANSLLNTKLKPTPDLCEQIPTDACERASKRYGFDWCAVVRSLPRAFGSFTKFAAEDPVVPPFVVRYFVGADARAAYFLVEELNYYSGYALLEVDREQSQLQLLRYTSQRLWGVGGCLGGGEICWRRFELLRAANGQYHSNYGDDLKTSASCQSANAYSSARAAALAPQPLAIANQKVAQCVGEIVQTAPKALIEEASGFNILSVNTYSPRQCVLAEINKNLLVGTEIDMLRPEFVRTHALRCCGGKQ